MQDAGTSKADRQGWPVFIDTNVLLYIHDIRSPIKSERCAAWLRAVTAENRARINMQSLNELAHVFLRKKWFSNPHEAFAVIDAFAALGSTPVTMNEMAAARRIHLSTGYAWWDCLLLASALDLGCGYFLSEDLQDGQIIEGLTIVDPFAHSPEQVLNSG